MNSTPDRLNLALADRYTVDGEIGSGGMATVYLAHGVKHERQVALKVPVDVTPLGLGGYR